jgi:hypothetical protein
VRRAALLAVLLLAGCGGGTQTVTVATTARIPPLPRATTEKLAAEADAVAADLDRGDGCTARTDAARLATDTIAAINAHEIPGIYEEELLGRAQALQGSIICVPPVPAPAPPAHDKGKHKGHGHDHGGGNGD